jgi:predicted phosphodiesterase
MKTIAIISDIHANLEALNLVLDDIKHRNVDAIYCLGDVVGYGPQPIECLEKTLSVASFILLGNHEEAVLAGAFGFNPSAKEAVDWTRSQLKPRWGRSSKLKLQWEALTNFALMYTENDYLYVHASPRDPTMDYVLKSDTEDVFGEVPEKIKEILSQTDKACFIGHTHMPGIITAQSKWYSPCDFDYVWEYKNGDKIICNIGSVGQPRDKDNRSCYVTCTDKEIFYHRLPYDFRRTQKKLRSVPELDEQNAVRLEFGN